MRKICNWENILLLNLIIIGLTSCVKKIASTDVFIEQMYAGEHTDDYALKISTFKEELPLTGYKINLYESKELAYTCDLSSKTITNKDSLVIFNKDFSEDKTINSNSIVLPDNYLYGKYYLEILDSNNCLVDSLGIKGFAIEYLDKGSIIRLDEYRKAHGDYEKLDYVSVRYDSFKYLKDETKSPLTLEELLKGPTIDKQYIGLGFNDTDKPLGGFVEANVKRLGDGDTTFFYFLNNSSLDNNKSVRYLLIDTPEVDHGPGSHITAEAWGDEAARVNNEKLKNAKRILIQSNKGAQLKENYGRYLGYVWYSNEIDGDYLSFRNLNYEMALDGLARFSTYDKYVEMYSRNILYYDYFNYAASLAKSKGIKIYGEKDPNFKS